MACSQQPTASCRGPSASQRVSLAPTTTAQPGALRRLPAVDTRWRRQAKAAQPGGQRLRFVTTATAALPTDAGRQELSRHGADTSSMDTQHPLPNPLCKVALRLAAAAAAAAVLCLPVAPLAADAAEYSYNGRELFAPMAYSGRWYEVASLKKGFAGEGQADCHCTQVRRAAGWADEAVHRVGMVYA